MHKTFFKNNIILFLSSVFLFIGILLSDLNSVKALQVTEIMYDPAGTDGNREWFEIYNDKNIDEDLTKYKFYYEGECKLKSIAKDSGNNILKSGEYAVIVVGNNANIFKNDYKDFVGNLFYTGYSAPASGILRNSTSTSASVIDQRNVGLCDPQIKYKYDFIGQSQGDGESFNIFYDISTSTDTITKLQTSSVTISTGSYISTPGTLNKKQNISVNNTTQTLDEKVANMTYTAGNNPRSYTVGDIKIQTPKEIFTIAGGYTFIPARVVNSKNEILKSDILWSMGDGIEIATTSPEYVYKNSGEYIAVIEALTNDRVYGIERVKVNVNKPNITITEVNENFIKIYNGVDDEVDIGGFFLICNNERFKISKHLILSPLSDYYFYNNNLDFKCLKDYNLIQKDIDIKILFPDLKLLHKYEYKNSNFEKVSLTSHDNINISSTTNIIIDDKSANLIIDNKYVSDLSSKEKIFESVITKNITNTQKPNIKPLDKPKSESLVQYKQNDTLLNNTTTQIQNTSTNIEFATNTNATSSSQNVDNNKSFWKKLLYFIYE